MGVSLSYALINNKINHDPSDSTRCIIRGVEGLHFNKNKLFKSIDQKGLRL